MAEAAAAEPKKKLSRAERKAIEERQARERAARAAKGAPKIQPKMGKFVADRDRADESLRVVGLFKEYSERGKVIASLIPQLLKELFKGIGKELGEPLASKLEKAGKAALQADKVAAGDFSTWYFEHAWPAIGDARQEAKQRELDRAKARAEAQAQAEAAREAEEEAAAAQQVAVEAAAARAAEEKAAAASRAAPPLSASASPPERHARDAAVPAGNAPPAAGAALARGRRQQAPSRQAGGRRADSRPDGDPAEPTAARDGALDAAAADEAADDATDVAADGGVPPAAGWAAAAGIDVAESRRVIRIFAAAASGARAASTAEPQLSLPSRSVGDALRTALLPVEDPSLVARVQTAATGGAAGGDGGAGVPIGKLVRFWHEAVWPKHRLALVAAHQATDATGGGASSRERLDGDAGTELAEHAGGGAGGGAGAAGGTSAGGGAGGALVEAVGPARVPAADNRRKRPTTVPVT